MTKNLLSEVFTPSRPARKTYVDRSKINDRIVRALKTPGTQIIVYGHSGSGKTTLLENVLFKVYENHIRTNCMKGMTFEQILTNAFDQLEPFFESEKTSKTKTTKNYSIGAELKSIKASLGANRENETSLTERRALPLQLTAQNLAKYIGSAKACWVLEDFHKIEEDEKIRFAQMLKVFADMSDEYPELKIVAIGAVNSAREVIKFDKEMQNRIAQIQVELMTDDEISQIVAKGSELLNIEFEGDCKHEIVHSSNGLAAICHKLCFIMCDKENIYETLDHRHAFIFNSEHLDEAISEHISDNSDTMKAIFDKAYKLKDAEKVMRILSACDSSGETLQELLSAMQGFGAKISEQRLTDMLSQLQTDEYGNNLIYDTDSCKYSFSNPFFTAFARGVFQTIDRRSFKTKARLESELSTIFNQVIQSLVNKTLQGSIEFTQGDTEDSGEIIDPR